MIKNNKRNIMLLLFVVPFLMGTGMDLYVPALPALTKYYHASNIAIQLTISLYVFGYAVGQIVLGVLSDSVGRKYILVTSSVLYTLISILTVYAPDAYVLILCRFMQGVAIGGLGVVSRAIATDCFTGIDLTKALTFYSISYALGPILGPFIGSYLQHFFTWKADFIYFAVYGCFVMIFVLATVTETNTNPQPLELSAISKTVFEVLMHPAFLMCSMVAAFSYTALVLFNMIAPFLVQNILGYSVLCYGHLALILGFAYFIGNVSNRFLLNVFNPNQICLFAMIVGFIVSAFMVIFNLHFPMSLNSILIPTFIVFAMCGLILPNNAARCVSIFPNLGGTGNALLGALMAVGVFIVTTSVVFFKATSQLPISLVYVVIFAACIVMYVKLSNPMAVTVKKNQVCNQ